MTRAPLTPEMWIPELTFAARLALVRHRMGWNIKEAALACGLKPQSWRGWELERRLPHNIVLVAETICIRSGVSRDWLLFGGPLVEGQPNPFVEQPAAEDTPMYVSVPAQRRATELHLPLDAAA